LKSVWAKINFNILDIWDVKTYELDGGL
jgi:hypothetical protein